MNNKVECLSLLEKAFDRAKAISFKRCKSLCFKKGNISLFVKAFKGKDNHKYIMLKLRLNDKPLNGLFKLTFKPKTCLNLMLKHNNIIRLNNTNIVLN